MTETLEERWIVPQGKPKTARDVLVSAMIEENSGPHGSKQYRRHQKEWIGEYRYIIDIALTALSAAGYSIVHESEIHGATVERFRQEIERLKPHYQHQTTVNAGRRQMLEHFEVFACRALPDGGVE